MKKISCFFLFLLVCFGCGDESSNQDEIVKDEIIEDKPAKNIIWEKDGKEMVLIPAGSFEMGDHFLVEGYANETPVHTVTLDAFYMDTHEVTVGQFREFVNQTGYSYDRWNDVATKYSPGDNYPMVYVNWNDATAYAEWAGKRLPTEAEWEYAARGGLAGKRYSWGDDESHKVSKLARDYANYYGTGGIDQWDTCSPVGSFAANGYGLYDVDGNVEEWCQDWYGHYSSSSAENPLGPSTGMHRILRGGSWNSPTRYLRMAARNYNFPHYSSYDTGFRCVSGSN